MMMSLAQRRRLRRVPLPNHLSVSSSFPVQRSMLNVRCSMFIFLVFDVHLVFIP
jgi:hypothetical protein